MMNREQSRQAKKEIQKVQKMEPAKFAVWLSSYSKACYEDGFGDGIESNTMAMMRYLHDDFGFGNVRFQRLVECAKRDILAMREGYLTPKDVRDGLAEEGCTCLKGMLMKGEPDPVREWVPVEATLPPDEEKVLCCTVTKKGAKNLVIGCYTGGMWRVGMNSNVIAWRFLPPVYEDKKE